MVLLIEINSMSFIGEFNVYLSARLLDQFQSIRTMENCFYFGNKLSMHELYM